MLRFLLPKICILCNDHCSQLHNICSACKADLPWLIHCCAVCAQPLAERDKSVTYCASCLKKPPYFDKVIAAFYYDFPADLLITKLKFQHQLLYAQSLGQLLTETINLFYKNIELPKLIIPVPLHINRLRERGFNQALEICKPLSQKLNIPIEYTSCIRQIATKAQSTLPITDRKQNIKNAFKLLNNIKEKHIAIVDDVITTGETVNELAKILKDAGIEKIDVWCCARTAPSFQL